MKRIVLHRAAVIAHGFYEAGAIVDVDDDYPVPTTDVIGEDGQPHPVELATEVPEEAPPEEPPPEEPPPEAEQQPGG